MSILKLIVSGVLLTASMASVASTNLGTIDPTDGASFNSANGLTGAFANEYDFNLTGGNYNFLLTVTNSIANHKVGISNFNATLDGNAFGNTLYNIPLSSTSKLNFLYGENVNLSSGHHELVISGIGSKSNYGGSISISSVPVPAAVWLMGSALVGLVSFGKRKKA